MKSESVPLARQKTPTATQKFPVRIGQGRETSIGVRMEWLKDYEGGRGVAYLLAIVGMIAPTMLALFLIAQPLFLTMEWIKLLLLCASVGGLCIAVCVSGALFEKALEAHGKGLTPVSVELRAEIMKGGLIFGSVQALLAQLFALVIAVSAGASFAVFLRAICLIVLGLLLASTVPGIVKNSWKTIRRKRE